MTLSERLSQLKSARSLTTEKLSQLSGVPRGTINKLLNGETQNPTARTLRQLALALGCPSGDLYASEEPSSCLREDPGQPVRRRDVPFYGEYADTAFPATGEEPRCDFALPVEDSSLEDLRIRKGDVVFVRRTDDVESGSLAALEIDGVLTLARLFRLEDGSLLIEKKGAPPAVYSGQKLRRVRILGRAVSFQSNL